MSSNNKVKILGTMLGIILFIALIAGISYAWISWRSSNISITGKTECFNINYTVSQSLNTNDVYLFNESSIIHENQILVKEGMAMLDITASIDSACNIPAELIIDLDVTELNEAYISGDSMYAFKYVLASYDPTITDISELKGQYLNIIQKNSITNTGITTMDSITLDDTTKGYVLIFYVDGNLAYNDAQDSTFAVTIIGTAKQTE